MYISPVKSFSCVHIGREGRECTFSVCLSFLSAMPLPLQKDSHGLPDARRLRMKRTPEQGMPIEYVRTV